MRHIMVATDGSSGANRAIDVAAELAKAVGGDLLIATAADSQLEEEARQFARVEGNIGDVLEALTAKTLKDAEARARRLGVSHIELRTGSGDIAESLIGIAAGNSVKMIVVGRRGRGQLAGLLLGASPTSWSSRPQESEFRLAHFRCRALSQRQRFSEWLLGAAVRRKSSLLPVSGIDREFIHWHRTGFSPLRTADAN